MTPQEREDLRAKFTEVEDWLYEEGMDLDAKAYEKKRAELEKLAAPVFLRKSELEARPKVVSQAREATNWTESILEAWVSERPEVTAEEREKVLGMMGNFTIWLDEMESEQEALPLHEPPAFTSREVSIKLEPIEREVHLLLTRLLPPAQPSAPPPPHNWRRQPAHALRWQPLLPSRARARCTFATHMPPPQVRRLIKKPKPKPPKKPKASSNATSTNSTAANKTAEAGAEAEAPPEVEASAAPESEAGEGKEAGEGSDDTPKHDEL